MAPAVAFCTSICCSTLTDLSPSPWLLLIQVARDVTFFGSSHVHLSRNVIVAVCICIAGSSLLNAVF